MLFIIQKKNAINAEFYQMEPTYIGKPWKVVCLPRWITNTSCLWFYSSNGLGVEQYSK